jgi:hypothetical protein
MTITKEQVADLWNQDVVRLTNPVIPGLVVEGKLYEVEGVLGLCSWMTLRRKDGEPGQNWLGWDLTVVSRAPRPLYVNHPRTEPVAGDYAHELDADGKRLVLRVRGTRYPDKWIDQDGLERTYSVRRRLRLLVDGETGQVVP